MARQSRSKQIDAGTVGIYHCFNQIVQQLFLLGWDALTGKDFGHRQHWLQDQMRELAAAMAIDVLDFAILDNHFHVILRNRPDLVANWSDEEVARRWMHVCPTKYLNKDKKLEITPAKIKALLEDPTIDITDIRMRLSSISWFMRIAEQRVATRANQENNRRGHFWGGRFKCRRITTLEGLLSCSLYVNLNLIRAGLANSLDESEYTSVYQRIRARWQKASEGLGQEGVSPMADDWLAPLFLDERSEAFTGMGSDAVNSRVAVPEHVDGESANGPDGAVTNAQVDAPGPRASDKGYLPIHLEEYLVLLTRMAQQLNRDVPITVEADVSAVLKKLKMDPQEWPNFVTQVNRLFGSLLGQCLVARVEAKRRRRKSPSHPQATAAAPKS